MKTYRATYIVSGTKHHMTIKSDGLIAGMATALKTLQQVYPEKKYLLTKLEETEGGNGRDGDRQKIPDRRQ